MRDRQRFRIRNAIHVQLNIFSWVIVNTQFLIGLIGQLLKNGSPHALCDAFHACARKSADAFLAHLAIVVDDFAGAL